MTDKSILLLNVTDAEKEIAHTEHNIVLHRTRYRDLLELYPDAKQAAKGLEDLERLLRSKKQKHADAIIALHKNN